VSCYADVGESIPRDVDAAGHESLEVRQRRVRRGPRRVADEDQVGVLHRHAMGAVDGRSFVKGLQVRWPLLRVVERLEGGVTAGVRGVHAAAFLQRGSDAEQFVGVGKDARCIPESSGEADGALVERRPHEIRHGGNFGRRRR